MGIVLYILFGQSFRKTKIFSRKAVVDSEYLFTIAAEQKETLKAKLKNKAPNVKEKSHLMTLMLNNQKAMLTENNDFRILINGSETFPAMLDAIRNARKFVHLEFFRFDIDTIGNEFRDALMRKAAEGVEVRIIIDDVGSWSFKSKYIRDACRGRPDLFIYARKIPSFYK